MFNQKSIESIIKELEERGYDKDQWVYVSNQTSLPKLPVPPLEQTIRKYKENMKTLLTSEQYFRLETITKTFMEDANLGPKLQDFLLNRQENLDNWVYQYWVDSMYLSNNAPLPIHSNPGYLTSAISVSENDICRIGASVVRSAFIIDELTKHNIFLNQNSFFKLENSQICMNQNLQCFRSARIPGKETDYLSTTNDKEINHIIVIYLNDFYYVPIPMLESDVDEEYIHSHLQLIMKNVKQNKTLPVGVLTSLERREWWQIRSILMKNSTNQQNLRLIESALFVLCLDTQLEEKFMHTDKHIPNKFLFSMCLHGGGIDKNSGNRWFDKTLQFIISEKVIGVCIEHSSLEGTASATIVNHFIEQALKTANHNYTEKAVQLNKLEWVLEDCVVESINKASVKLDALIKDLDLEIWSFDGYGTTFIKSHKCSPDGFVQLILQLTYFKLYGKLCASYESASLRAFRKGRVDCIRSNTVEVFKWVKKMVKSDVDNSVKLQLWRVAINSQYKETKAVLSGQGIDNHLLGLREAAKEILDDIPELFTDESYSIANKFIMSTSQVAALGHGIAGFGPVEYDGYGIFYLLYSSKMHFNVSSFRSCRTTSNQKFLNELEHSLLEVKAMLEYVNYTL